MESKTSGKIVGQRNGQMRRLERGRQVEMRERDRKKEKERQVERE